MREEEIGRREEEYDGELMRREENKGEIDENTAMIREEGNRNG